MKIHICDICGARLPVYGHSVITVNMVVHCPRLADMGNKGHAVDLCEGCAGAMADALAARRRAPATQERDS